MSPMPFEFNILAGVAWLTDDTHYSVPETDILVSQDYLRNTRDSVTAGFGCLSMLTAMENRYFSPPKIHAVFF